MKEPKRTQLALLALAGGIWFHSALLAQESVPAEPTPQAVSPAVGTNVTGLPGVMAEAADQDTNGPAAAVTDDGPAQRQGSRGLDRGPLVSIGHDVELKAGESAECVVVIFGSARVHGKVRDAAVAVLGDLEIDGEVGDAAVTVLGDLLVRPNAKIRGEAVAVGGKVDAASTASIRGQPVTVDFPAWLKTWFVQCVLKLRPLSLQVGWVWAVAGVVFLLYLLIAAVFPRPIEACVNELTRRPTTTFFTGLLAQLLLPVVIFVLTCTGIGLVVVPFLIAALVLGAAVGKVGVLEWLGFRVGRRFGARGLQNGLVALVIGAVIIVLLYLVPVLGLLTFGIISVWGLGVAVTAAFGGLRKELPLKPSAPPTGAGMPPPAGPETVQGTETMAPGAASPGASWSGVGGPSSAAAAMPSAPSHLPETLSYPRAGFWERMGAGFLDIVLVSILGSIVHVVPLGFLLALAYFTGMWAWKGTTIGGIVLGLKVVRMDSQPVTFAVALVRSLAAAFSIVVLFLGFLWIAWDTEAQGWHDKIAGTVVLKLPRGTPLVCF
jgi:uncharacterized RDD family membrane protein YckC